MFSSSLFNENTFYKTFVKDLNNAFNTELKLLRISKGEPAYVNLG